MRTRLLWLTASSLVLMGAGPVYAQGIINLLTNPGLEDGTANGWGGYGDNTREVVQSLNGAAIPEDPIEGNYCMHVTVGSGAANFWDSGLTLWGGNVFEQGKQYTFSVWLKSMEGDREINFKPEQSGTWTPFGEKRITMTEEWAEYFTTTPVMDADVPNVQISIHVGFGPGEFWMDAARLYVGEYVETVFGPRVTSKNPVPADGAVDVPYDTGLGWVPSATAGAHNVYFGDTFADVNSADIASPLLVSPGQTGNTLDLDRVLEFDKVYYWRVDDINSTPDKTVFKGNVWSFTVEPYAYPVTNITATASSTDKPDQGPENTINGSGLDGNDQHSMASNTMWVSSMTGPQPTWIQYEFDRPYRLLEMWVWNYNVEFEVVLGFGFKDVTVEHSLDGVEWTVLTDTEFARGPAADGYAHDTVVDFGGVTAKYIRLTANSNWGRIMPQYGLSEVRFYHVPVQARVPVPASGDAGVPLDVVLDWREGREAVSHDVYLSTDREAVTDGTAFAGNVTESQYQPSPLEFGQRYYWKVNEVNEAASPSIQEGDLWWFATSEYEVIDDFESYTDEVGERVFQTWIDGFGYTEPEVVQGNGTGSTVGNFEPPFAERTIYSSGSQSMPMAYDNAISPFYSETERTWAVPQNWTVHGADTLWVHFRGSPVSFAETSPGHYTISSTSGDVWGNTDHFRYVYKELNGDGSMVAQIHSMSYAADWSKAGVMIRETLDADSTHAFMMLTPDGRRAMQNRPIRSNASASAHSATDAITFPFWVKIVRQGNQFTGYYSQNGVDWVQQPDDENTGADASPNPQTISMIGRVYIGMAVTSNNASASACVAEFSDVTATGSVTGQWQVADIGGDIPGNDPDQLYVAVQDSAGRVAVLPHPDPQATLLDEWIPWPTLLSDLTAAGLNMAAVKKMYIGVGDRDNPQPGGVGKIYIDDIRFGRPAPADEPAAQ